MPELSHIHPHVVTLILVPRPPDQFEKLPPGHHFARVLDQDREQFVLNGRQVNLVSLNKHLPAYQVYSKLAHFKLPIVRAHRLQRMAQRYPNPGQQFGGAEGLGEIIVGPRIQRFDLIALFFARRNDNDRRIGPFAQAARHIQAIQVGQAQIQNDDIGMVQSHLVDALTTRRRFEQPVAAARQRGP